MPKKVQNCLRVHAKASFMILTEVFRCSSSEWLHFWYPEPRRLPECEALENRRRLPDLERWRGLRTLKLHEKVHKLSIIGKKYSPEGKGEYKVSVSKTNWNCTRFLSSTEMALASLRKTAFPQRSSLRLVNWCLLHLPKAHEASSYSWSDQWQGSASKMGLTNTSSSWLNSSGVMELYMDMVMDCSITCFCSDSIWSSYFLRSCWKAWLASSLSFLHWSSISFNFLAISAFKSMPCLAINSSWAKSQSIRWSASASSLGDAIWAAVNSRACSGWLKRKTWFLPRITRDPVLRVTELSIFLPLTKHMALGLGTSLTTPLTFSKWQCSLRIWDPTSWMSWGFGASGEPTLVRPSLM